MKREPLERRIDILERLVRVHETAHVAPFHIQFRGQTTTLEMAALKSGNSEERRRILDAWEMQLREYHKAPSDPLVAKRQSKVISSGLKALERLQRRVLAEVRRQQRSVSVRNFGRRGLNAT